MTATTIVHTRWDDVTAEQLTPHVLRRYLSTDRLTVAQFHLNAGGVVPRHSHENDQMTCVLSGALRFVWPGGTADVRAGETARIPSQMAHEVHVLEDALVIDVFTPVRRDWIDGTDTYFHRA
ncbi:MAG TPA: cupin domain-containing protein [Vicinamibacterales bacterium]|jgi:quercetin dioxygenase-like cupin family protein